MSCIDITKTIVDIVGETETNFVIEVYEDLIWERAEPLIQRGSIHVRERLDMLLYEGFRRIVYRKFDAVEATGITAQRLAGDYASHVAKELDMPLAEVIQIIWDYLESQ